ncbi:helix-turn-helix domain-containing protein [Planctomycetota bacterium]|nr:helix-turn-helix domain-containing protein [Planctomycetota bacterium]
MAKSGDGKRTRSKRTTKFLRIPRKSGFLCHELEELNLQLLYSPIEQREKQYLRAEKLHDQIVDQQQYPLDFLVYRITGKRLSQQNETLLVGEAIRPDMRLIIDAMTNSLELSVDESSYETVNTLATRLNVSTKTISRWRKEGLRWRQARLESGKKKRIIFTEDAIRTFTKSYQDRVTKASSFRRLDDRRKNNIISDARQIVTQHSSTSFNRTATRIAKKQNIAVETVRQIITKYDTANQDKAIFENHAHTINEREKKIIVRMHSWGIAVSRIANHFGRTRSTIYRAIHQHEYEELKCIDLPYIELQVFNREDADEVILRQQLTEIHSHLAGGKLVPLNWEQIPLSIWYLFEKPRIRDKTARSLFVRYNYLKYKANQLRETISQDQPSAKLIEDVYFILDQVKVIHGLLIDYHTSHFVSNVRLHFLDQDNVPLWSIFNLLEVAAACLSDVIREYNPSRSTSFATTLKNHIMRRLIQAQQDMKKGKAVKRESKEQLVERYMTKLNLLKNEY